MNLREEIEKEMTSTTMKVVHVNGKTQEEIARQVVDIQERNIAIALNKIIDLCKQWALEMVGEDIKERSSEQTELYWHRVGRNDQNKMIRERINKA